MKIINLDLDDEFINKFYALTSSTPPEMITIVELKEQIINIKSQIDKLKKALKYASENPENPEPHDPIELGGTNQILVVDNLGVITYQVQKILSKFGFNIITAKDVYNALSQIEDKEYDFIIMDLCIPTEREGFILLAELQKNLSRRGLKTVLGVMSVAGKKEYKARALEEGADFYIEKSYNWQQKLSDIISDYISSKG